MKSLNRLYHCIFICLLFSCSDSAITVSVNENIDLALVGPRLIDGTGNDPIPDSVLLIGRGRIQAVGSRQSIDVPEGTETINLSGKTIIPGLVALHAHYGGPVTASEQALKNQLYYGVTTTRSIGSDTPDKVSNMLEQPEGSRDIPAQPSQRVEPEAAQSRGEPEVVDPQ